MSSSGRSSHKEGKGSGNSGRTSKKDKAARKKSNATTGDDDAPAPVREMSGLKLDKKARASGSSRKDSAAAPAADAAAPGDVATAPAAVAAASATDAAPSGDSAAAPTAAATGTGGGGGAAPSGSSNSSSKSERARPAFDKTIIKANGVSYMALAVVGNGSFGVVIQAEQTDTKEVVAIKKVLQDKRFKNRELQIMKILKHRHVVMLKNSFYTSGNKSDDVYLNLVLEYVPETVYRVSRSYTKQKQHMPVAYVKCYTYQLLKALEYIHQLGICHRDIKPQNLLLDTVHHVLKLCDFGSAKILVKGEPNVAYICSRYYRAPELIFGATDYTTDIDVWSTGCVMAELLLGAPMFPGDSGMDQLVEIIKVLGTPTRVQIKAMNPNYTEFKFPQIRAHPWTKVFRSKTPDDAVDLASKLLVYEPDVRLSAARACQHHFFDDLRDPAFRLPKGQALPILDGIAHTFPEGATCTDAAAAAASASTTVVDGAPEVAAAAAPAAAADGDAAAADGDSATTAADA